MKTIFITKAYLMSVIFCAMAMTASAHDFEYEGKFFNIVSAADHTCEVTADADGSKYAGFVFIDEIAVWNDQKYTVVGISDEAFLGCSELTSVETPSTLQYVGRRAFVNSHKLSVVDFADGLLRIGDSAFSGCRGLINITLPASLRQIGSSVFASSSLHWAKFRGAVDEMGASVFTKCMNLETVEFHPSQRILPANTFADCQNMQGIALPDSLESVGSSCFKGCINLQSITIPDRVHSIGSEAFYGCTWLLSVSIGASVAEVGTLAFANCLLTESIKVDERNPYLDSRNNCNAIIRTSTNELLAGCKETRCPPRVERIADKAFYQCKRLQTIKLPSTVTYIGREAFKDCLWLRRAYIDNRDCQIGGAAFEGCRYLYEEDGLRYADWYLLTVDTMRTSYVIKEGTRRIAPYAFSSLDILDDRSADYKIETINIPNSVVDIGAAAFMKCAMLRRVTLGDSITAIPDYAFAYCYRLRDVNINENIISIGREAFNTCPLLRSIYIPSRVTNITDMTFIGCNSVESIVVHPDNPVFDSRDSCNAIIRTVTDELIFGGPNTTVPYGVKRIGSRALAGREGLTSIDLPESVTRIGYGAFRECHNLLSVTMTNSVTTIGSEAFKECWHMKSIILSDSVSEILNGTFSDCSELEFIHLPAALKTLSDNVFEYCVSMHEIVLPAELKKIKGNVFSTAENLERIYILASTPPELVSFAFSNVQYLNTRLYVPEGSLYAYMHHPVWQRFRYISEFDATPVDAIAKETNSHVVHRYDMSGRVVNSDYRGIVLERMSNGDVRKVVIR